MICASDFSDAIAKASQLVHFGRRGYTAVLYILYTDAANQDRIDVRYEGEPDPSLMKVNKGVQLMNAFNPDALIAVGGDLPMDAAKVMWLMYEHPEIEFEGTLCPRPSGLSLGSSPLYPEATEKTSEELQTS